MRKIIRNFWNCGDAELISFAMERANLNKKERAVLNLTMNECMTQEQVAELLDLSPRCVQTIWCSATDKMLKIPWVLIIGNE